MKQIVNETMYRFSYLSRLQASPNEKRYSVVVAKANKKSNQYDSELYIGDKSLTSVIHLGQQADTLFWSDETVLLVADANKKRREKTTKERQTRLSVLDVSTKKVSYLATLPIPISLERRLSETDILVSSSLSQTDHMLYEGDAKDRRAYLKRQQEEAFAHDIEELPFLFNGAGFVYGKRKQLFILNLKTYELTRITPKEFSYSQVEVREDGALILSGLYEAPVRVPTSGLYEYNLQKQSFTELLAPDKFKIDRFFLQASSILVFASDMKTFGLNQNPDLYQLRQGNLDKIADYGYSVYSTVGADVRYGGTAQAVQGTPAYSVTTHDDHTDIIQIDSQGIKRVYEASGSIDGLIAYQGGFLAIGLPRALGQGQDLQEVYRIDTSFTVTPLSSFNKKSLSGYYVAPPMEVVVQKPNHTVKGWVLLPQDYDEKTDYPTILDIHGGPKTVYGAVYYHEMQVWANAGYIVCFANPRGSDGKGDAFADIRGRYGDIDYQDLMDFTDEVVKRYRVDERRLFVTGGSYGGFMTNWMVGHTKRFKAAVTQRSISNWVSFCGTSDIGHTFGVDQAGGHPVMDMEKLWHQSPLKYAMNVTTPLLFIHSDKDHRCPMEQAEQFHSVLKTNGVDTRFIWFNNENHELSRSGKPHARIKRLSEIEAWFGRFV
jgi:dipeptidyl aminopeptidase/acylaminoacyl peptidase